MLHIHMRDKFENVIKQSQLHVPTFQTCEQPPLPKVLVTTVTSKDIV